uniref:Uncharacterized protein n=1 Tax=Cacopsylla melanoneura TaxID=428564 RepID=A0A8D8ZSW3_9HEMI
MLIRIYHNSATRTLNLLRLLPIPHQARPTPIPNQARPTPAVEHCHLTTPLLTYPRPSITVPTVSLVYIRAVISAYLSYTISSHCLLLDSSFTSPAATTS